MFRWENLTSHLVRTKNSSYYIAPVGDWTHDPPHTVASNMVNVSHALNHSATEAVYITCHLGHYIWLVILDIVYILSSCTYDLQSMQIIWHVCKTIKDPSLIHKNICLLATHWTSLMCNNTFFLITWKKVNLVPEHAISFMCLILRNDPPIISLYWPNSTNTSKISSFCSLGVGQQCHL